jgi:mono/diheme cytochrome c family protein
VYLSSAPDGALYVVDMYRGVIQHKNFVTTFLRRQIEARGLERPIGLGRIWRVTAAGAGAAARAPDLATAPATALVDALASANGALRDVALRELVQRGARELAEPLRERLHGDARPAARIVLLSALAGIERLTATDVRAALRDSDAGVLAMGLQYAAAPLAGGDPFLWAAVERLRAAPPAVTWQLALTLGDVLALPIADAVRERCRAELVALVLAHPADARLRAAVAVAAAPQELLPVLQAACVRAAPPAVLRDLSGRATKLRQPAISGALLAWAAAQPRETAAIVLAGVRDALPRGPQRSGSLLLADVAPLAQLAREANGDLQALANELLGAVALQGAAARAEVAQLTDVEQQRVREGERVYARSCAACHQLHGGGMQGLAPPLRDSEWVLGPPDRLVRIALHGVRGAIEVQGGAWSLEMPGQRQLGDEEVAAVLSYVRRAFDHRGSVLQAADVAAQRARFPGRSEPWTAAELLGGK